MEHLIIIDYYNLLDIKQRHISLKELDPIVIVVILGRSYMFIKININYYVKKVQQLDRTMKTL